MNELALREWVAEFEKLFESFESLLVYRNKLGAATDQLATRLCKLYAIWGAYQIRRCIGLNHEFDPELTQDKTEQPLGLIEKLPKREDIHRVAPDLFLAVEAVDEAAVSNVLKMMGILSICPMPERVFCSMDEIVLHVSGAAKQIFLVDLSLFASAVGDYRHATRYSEEARTFDPRSRELYDVCVIEGLIAMNDGRVGDALQCLDRAIAACQADVDSSIQCSLRAPNLELAEKLLGIGERIAVLNHLFECRNVWQLRRPQIEVWMHDIEGGKIPEFRITDPLAHRLNVQWMRACSLEFPSGSTVSKRPMSPGQVLLEREKRDAEFEHIMNKCVREELEYLEKSQVDEPDRTE